MDRDDALEERAGIWFALTAYSLWGILPVYFKLVGFAAPLEIIAHRICWAVVVLLVLIFLRRQQYLLRTFDWSTIGSISRSVKPSERRQDRQS